MIWRRSLLSLVAGALAALLAYAGAAAFFAARMLQSDDTYALIARYGDASSFGIGADSLPAAAAALSAYMRGEADSPQITVTAFGRARPLYNGRELAHLADVRALAVPLRRIAALCALAAAALLALCLRPRRRRLAAAALGLGHALLLIPLLWAAVDFDGLFTLVHRLLFANDLWLLNPYTDALILLMPESYFTALAGRLGLRLAGVGALFALAVWAMLRPGGKGKPGA